MQVLVLVLAVIMTTAMSIPPLAAASPAHQSQSSRVDSRIVGRIDSLGDPDRQATARDVLDLAGGLDTPGDGWPVDSGTLIRGESSLLFDDFALEPGVDEVQAWAVDHARLSPFEASRLVRQARLRGALPTVRLHARYRSAAATDWDELDVVDGRKLDNDLSINLWLEWDLAELAAGTDMARALRESRARLELRHAVLSQVTTDYFDRRLLRAQEQLEPAENTVDIVARRLRVQELNATLDGLTGGRWSHALRSDPSERTRQDLDPRLRIPIHATDRPSDP